MTTIEWQLADISFEEESQIEFTTAPRGKEKMHEENCKEAFQLKKYRNPSQDLQRQDILSIIEKFGTLLVARDFEKIATDLLTEDFEAFVFSSTGRISVQHYTEPSRFMEIYKNTIIQHRAVKITNVDSEKNVAWQTSEYNMICEYENVTVSELACEVFTIKDKRISKYRACFGPPVSGISEFEKFLRPTRKDRMLAKVKEINYALAGQPDFEKIASLFNENTEYRIWSWDDHKCFTFYKHDFPFSFKDLQENMQIRRVVPYELSVDSQQKFISGTYAYYLEERFSGKKYVWLSTCVYGFDPHVNLVKISQQGELYPDGEIEIPFESYSRENLTKIVVDLLRSFDQGFDAFYSDVYLYDCALYSIIPEEIPNPGYYQGMKHIEKLKLMMSSADNMKLDDFDIIDTYIDHHSEVHDVVLVLSSSQVTMLECGNNKKEPFIYFGMCDIEGGKLAKQLEFISRLQSPVSQSIRDEK